MLREHRICVILMVLALEALRDTRDDDHASQHNNTSSQTVFSKSRTQQRRPHSYLLLQPSSTRISFISHRPTREANYSFKPGELGMIHDDNGNELKVSDNGPAHTQGIGKANRMVKVATELFSKDAQARSEDSGSDFEVAFQVNKRLRMKEQTSSRLVAQLQIAFRIHRSLFLFLFCLLCAGLVFGEDMYYYVGVNLFSIGTPLTAECQHADTIPPNEKVTVDENTRMFLNGETKAVMEHAKFLHEQSDDHSIDQPWPFDGNTVWTDGYMLTTAALWLIPKSIICVPVSWVLCCPVVLTLHARATYLPTPCFQPDRSSWDYWAFVKFVRVISLPMLFFAIFCIVLDMIVYYLFSISYMLATWGWSKYFRSLAAIEPYRGGPSLLIAQSDIVTCILGQLCRHGVIETTCLLARVWVVIPFIKYYVNANPFLHSLEGRFVNQITTSMQDMSIKDILEASERVIVECKQDESLAAEADDWSFVPHYPYAPPWKRWSIGLQSAGSYSFLFVHTTHAKCCHGGSTEQYVISKSSIQPMFRVMLWYNNPYHIFTGWVEANLSSGLPSQPAKNRGGEHPMWLVGSRSAWSSSRNGNFTVASIDAFFDFWLPYIVYQVRKIVRGASKAEELREEVISKDGISQPALQKSVPLVPA